MAMRPKSDSVSKAKRVVSHADLITQQWMYEREDLELSNFLMHMYIVRLGRIFEQMAMRQCQQRFGLRIPDVRVLTALRRGGRPFARRPTDLFKALLVTSGAMTKQVDRLEKMKLVERIPDPAFGGGFLITLTKKGLAVVDEVVTVLAKESVIAPAMARLSANELETGTRFIRRLLNEMEVVLSDDGERGAVVSDDESADHQAPGEVVERVERKFAPKRKAAAKTA